MSIVFCLRQNNKAKAAPNLERRLFYKLKIKNTMKHQLWTVTLVYEDGTEETLKMGKSKLKMLIQLDLFGIQHIKPIKEIRYKTKHD